VVRNDVRQRILQLVVAEAADLGRLAAECNDEVAEMVQAYPTRFMGLGTLPMQDVTLAIAEMEPGRAGRANRKDSSLRSE
jgi:predicted TIM-barrel fold metal-dependent hydrolase